MQNLLLRHIRQKAYYSPEQTALAIGIELSTYLAIENGELVLSMAHSEHLGGLFDIDPEVLHASSLQLEMLNIAQELKHRRNWMIEMLIELVRLVRPGRKKRSL